MDVMLFFGEWNREEGRMKKDPFLMDVPKSCDVCEFVEDEIFGWYCGLTKSEKNVDDYTMSTPDWCPLKTWTKEQAERIQSEFEKAWNDCMNDFKDGG